MKLRLVLSIGVLLATTAACGGSNGEIKAPPELAARAAVTGEAARATALAAVPGGTMSSGELEDEGGRLIYSFDIKVEGQSGVQEVQVDALSGQVVSEEHETDSAEAAEARAAGDQAGPGPYRITHTYTLGGDGGWDYIIPDAPRHRLFIGREDRVMVVDEDGTLLGEVAGINGAHGIALAPDAGHGFATSGDDATVVMFDMNTFQVLGRIPAAEDADAIIYDAASNRVFSFNGDAHSSTVIDAGAGTLVTNIPLGGKPEYGASAGDGKVYVNLTDTNEVVEIDANTATVVRRWSTEPCEQPVAMAIDTANHRLFSGCRSGVLAVSDYQDGSVVATAPIGGGVDGVGFDPASGDVFASGADGTLTVIHQDAPDAYSVVQTLETAPASRNMGLDLSNHRVFVAAAKFAEGTTAAGRGSGAVLPGTFELMVIERETPGSQ